MIASDANRVVVGISGASGVVYGVRLLEHLRRLGITSHLVMTRSAQVTLAHELPLKVADVHRLADVVHKVDDIGASISSGSFHTLGMIVAPCSIRSAAEIKAANEAKAARGAAKAAAAAANAAASGKPAPAPAPAQADSAAE